MEFEEQSESGCVDAQFSFRTAAGSHAVAQSALRRGRSFPILLIPGSLREPSRCKWPDSAGRCYCRHADGDASHPPLHITCRES
jgi:hypothetical protein